MDKKKVFIYSIYAVGAVFAISVAYIVILHVSTSKYTYYCNWNVPNNNPPLITQALCRNQSTGNQWFMCTINIKTDVVNCTNAQPVRQLNGTLGRHG